MPLAIAEFLQVDFHTIEQRQPQIADRRFLREYHVPTGLERARTAAGHEDGQVLMIVRVAIMDAASVSDHRMVKQRSWPLLNRLELGQEVSQLLGMKDIDLPQLRLLRTVPSMVR